MAYSAVSHPSPRPRRQLGTPSSTDAVQSTRVAPNETRHEPSAYGATPRSSVTSRISSSRRVVRGGMVDSSAATQLLDRRGRRMAGRDRDDDHVASPRPNVVRAYDRRFRVVPALD